MPDEQRAEMCQKALEAAPTTAEQKLVLEVLKRYPEHGDAQAGHQGHRRFPSLKDDATQATLAIAQKLGGKGADVSELLSKVGLEKVKLEIVKAEYGAGSTQRT